MNNLTKVEALKLITPVIDNEVSDEEREAFFNFISGHKDVRRKYESAKKIKAIIQSRCPRAKAPDSLRKKVKDYIKKTGSDNQQPSAEAPIYDIPTRGPASQKINPGGRDSHSLGQNYKHWLFSSAASLLAIVVFWRLLSFSGEPANAAAYDVEEYTYEHFIKNEGQFVKPTISAANLASAEVRLASDFDMPVAIPELQDADFEGVVYAEFVPGYKAPMFEYYLPSGHQYIYIFAFKIDKLEKFGQLVRNEEAVKACAQSNDFHIQDINGKYVVSWKWGDVWYSAISNHTGDTLASLIKPLQYSHSQVQK